LRLVALNDPWKGDMKGIDFINYQCQKEAYDSEVKGVFRAFLSSPIDKGVDLISIVKNPNAVIVNLKNDTLFPTWKSIFNRSTKLWNFNTRVKIFSGLPPPTIYSFNGQDVIQGELSEHW
jgi:collagen type XVIII alpha